MVPSAEVPLVSAAGLLALLEYSAAVRATAATGVHDASSRSHAMYTLHLRRAAAAAGAAEGSLTLCDLAGSEARIDTDKHDAKRTKVSSPDPRPSPSPSPGSSSSPGPAPDPNHQG